MDQTELAAFVGERGLAVVATRGAAGDPEAALVGLAATDRGELVFDTSRRSRKFANLSAHDRVAVVIGWTDETTVQCEGVADVPEGEDHDRCLQAYFAQYPDGRERAKDPDIVHVRVSVAWHRYSDYRAESFGVVDGPLRP